MPFADLSHRRIHRGLLTTLLGLGFLLGHGSLEAAWGPLPTLWLSPAPAGKPGGGHEHLPAATRPANESPGNQGAAAKTTGRPSPPRQEPSGHDHGQAATGDRNLLESEHRPKASRSYQLNDRNCHGTISALLRRADGTLGTAEVAGDLVRFTAAMGDGPAHGANNLYVTEQWLDPDNTLVVRVAKWITMHHSCGWGHSHKFDPQRVTPQSLETIPFEIVLDDLWDSNFHSRLRSGDLLRITVLAQGKPAAGAEVTVHSAEGWIKELRTGADGTASTQLIRDYYPRIWSEFKRTRRGPLMITATYTAGQSGIFEGQPYNTIRYSGSLPWNYQPARQDFSSYIHGLLVALVMLTGSGFGIWIFRERRKKPYREVVFDE